MSHDSEIAEWGRAWNARRKERHAECNEGNRARLAVAGIPYSERPEALLFRDPKGPRVDFYPSTGRWRDLGTGKTYSGGADRFIAWYVKQPTPPGREGG